MEMFRFAYNDFLWALLIIPVLTVLFIGSRYLRKRALKRFANKEIIKERLLQWHIYR